MTRATGAEIKPTVGGWEVVAEMLGKAFAIDFPPDVSHHYGRMFEPDRSLGAYDDGELVGHACVWSLDMRMPGGESPVAGVTMCGVRPTHRRRGILSALMKTQLHDLHEKGAEPIAALTASEAAIYGRFGYGCASDQLRVELPRTPALRPVEGVDGVRIRYVDPLESAAVCGAIHNASTAQRPGSLRFGESWQDLLAEPARTPWFGWSSQQCVLAEQDGKVGGYAYYRTKPGFGGGEEGAVRVLRVHATDLSAYAALWRFLLDLDLTTKIVHETVAPDDPLLSLLADVRQAKASLADGVWIRLVDVDRALAARTYSVPVDTVLAVRDALCPWNAGRWRLLGDETGATCESTTARADIELDVRELGSVFLGRPSLAGWLAAGLVTERTPGAVTAVGRAFAHEPLPYRDTIF